MLVISVTCISKTDECSGQLGYLGIFRAVFGGGMFTPARAHVGRSDFNISVPFHRFDLTGRSTMMIVDMCELLVCHQLKRCIDVVSKVRWLSV